MVELWWESDEGALLEWEHHQLKQGSLPFEPDEKFIADARAYALTVQVPGPNGEPRQMRAVYPDLYPWFRPEVVSPDDDLEFHQGPAHKNLCLLDRPAEAWDPARDSLAFLLREQLPKVYQAQQEPDGAGLEVPQPEPFTAWYDYWPAGAFVVDGSWDLSGVEGGTFTYVLLRARPSAPTREQEQLVGVVVEVRDVDGTIVASADETLRRRFVELPQHEGQWGRLPEPFSLDPAKARRQLRRSHDHLRHAHAEALGEPGRLPRLEVVAGVFPIEASHRGPSADAWSFVVTVHPPENRHERRAKGNATAGRGPQHVAGLRGGRDDLAVRIPELAGLGTKTLAVFGVGGIGAPSAIELARGGSGRLCLIDHDRAEPEISVRYPVGYPEAGRPKVLALGEFIVAHQPLVELDAHGLRLGAVRVDGEGRPQQELLGELLDGVDLIYDATGDHGVALYLCDLAFTLGVPYVNVSTSLGAWGGRVAVFRPEGGPCFECLLAHLRDQEAQQTVPVEERLAPPADPDGQRRPVGCADATFTGAGFDVAAVAMAGVRLAVSVLLEGEKQGYPPVDWNVAVMRFRDEHGRALAGEAFHRTVARHPDCGECERRAEVGEYAAGGNTGA